MGKVIGIDLGTTNSCVAVAENDQPVIIHNSEGERTTPSVVAFQKDGDPLVGRLAKRQAITNPANTVFATKRLIGRRFNSKEIELFKEKAPYNIVPGEKGNACIQIQGKVMTPSQISAYILKKLKQAAEDYLDEPVDEAVITVPAYFDDAQRQATILAGQEAGLKVKRIINEPTAAALAYGTKKDVNANIAVFDLGGGTFDITILKISSGVYEVLATSGDTFLGGEDFDERLINYLVNNFRNETGLDLRQDPMALQRLKEAAEHAKQELSSLDHCDINLPFITADESGPKHLKIDRLERETFVELCSDLFDALDEPVFKALDDAKLKPEDVHDIVLVGGMTRVPAVQAKVEQIFKKKPTKGVNPDEVVAAGACLQGAILSGEMKESILLDVTPLSMGIETTGGKFSVVIPRNTTVPTQESKIFETVENNQDFVRLSVFQGESPIASENRQLGEFFLEGLPRKAAGEVRVEVMFSLDADGVLKVTAKEISTGKQTQVRIEPPSN
ncbi:MAG: molecular chaperone DnaK [Deltaproteobacteria bacterium]|nr:molecular chaperone DnaK [Deltaproteobacteria bacterium]